MTDSSTLRPSIALAAYAEALIDSRRVLVCGDATSDLATHLLARGARSVHVFDPDPARVAQATGTNTSKQLSFGELNESGLLLRDAAFDAAIIENLASVGNIEFVLKAVSRALSARGAALIACANPEVTSPLLQDPNAPQIAIDYYSLYDAVAEEFECVRMLGQTPFVGYAMADFAPEAEPSPALDTGFLPSGAEEPEWFIALASENPVTLEEYAVVQLPFAQVLKQSNAANESHTLQSSRSSERRLRQRLATLEDENRKLGRVTSAHHDTDEELERLKRELARRDGWIEELEARAAAADKRADQVESELEAEREKALDESEPTREKLQAQIKQLQQALEAARKELGSHSASEAQHEKELRRLRIRESELEEQLDAGDPELQRELERLEAQLKERGQQLQKTSEDLRKLEQLSRSLLRELEEVRQSGVAEDAEQLSALRSKLDELALKNASREADLVSMHWTVATLEGKLEALKPAPDSSSA
jgi:hypothetical protein